MTAITVGRSAGATFYGGNPCHPHRIFCILCILTGKNRIKPVENTIQLWENNILTLLPSPSFRYGNAKTRYEPD